MLPLQQDVIFGVVQLEKATTLGEPAPPPQ